MSSHIHYFSTPSRSSAVALPFDLDEWIAGWQKLRLDMIREKPDSFSRDEWAYLIEFLDPQNLLQPFHQAFGMPGTNPEQGINVLARPRGTVAIWLPNNVSLLGPLTLILVSLTGNTVRMKAGSQGDDLTDAFLQYGRSRSAGGPLAAYFDEQVQLERFERHDPRNAQLAATAEVRVVFGSNDAVTAIDGLPHPPGSIGIAFADRQSQAWLDVEQLDTETLSVLIKVFAIYGQAGCTSPGCVRLLNGTMEQALRLRDDLIALWPEVIRGDVPMHIASENVMAQQWAAALGWDAVIAPRNAAVVAVGKSDLEPVSSLMTLRIVPSSVDEAVEQLPENIQTIGHALSNSDDPYWLQLLAGTRVSRFVPLRRMHHFGPIWDGMGFWRQLFEEVEVVA